MEQVPEQRLTGGMPEWEDVMSRQLSRSTWFVVAVITAVIIAMMVLYPNNLWSILSIPLVLFVPGFIVTMILFPWSRLSIPERLLLSIGLSIALVALGGLILNLTPWGLQPSSLWIAFVVGLVIGIAILFYARRTWWREGIAFPKNANFNARQWVLMALAALMAVMAFRVARTPAPQNGLEGYTLLSAQAAGTPNSIRLGVRSEEFKETKYQIKYQFNGKVHDGPMLDLNPGQTWEQVVSIPVEDLGGKSFTVLLYRLDKPTDVYRYVDWWPETH
jgi:uncharacterized membrane protein